MRRIGLGIISKLVVSRVKLILEYVPCVETAYISIIVPHNETILKQ